MHILITIFPLLFTAAFWIWLSFNIHKILCHNYVHRNRLQWIRISARFVSSSSRHFARDSWVIRLRLINKNASSHQRARAPTTIKCNEVQLFIICWSETANQFLAESRECIAKASSNRDVTDFSFCFVSHFHDNLCFPHSIKLSIARSSRNGIENAAARRRGDTRTYCSTENRMKAMRINIFELNVFPNTVKQMLSQIYSIHFNIFLSPFSKSLFGTITSTRFLFSSAARFLSLSISLLVSFVDYKMISVIALRWEIG